MKSENMDVAKINAGFPVEWFVNPPERTKCAFCRNILNDPRNCKSGHLFCLDCIKTTLTSDGTVKCPICNTELAENDLTVHQFAQEAISELITYCGCHSKIGADGCGWTGMFKERDGRICDFQLVDCPNCNESVRRGNYDQHFNSDCQARPVSCTFCNTNLLQKDLASHRAACVERPVKCTGCQTVMPLSKMDAHHDNDCALNFIDCPLFKVGMCTPKCFGRVRSEDLETHATANAALTTRLVEELLKARAQLNNLNHSGEEEESSPRKRVRAVVEIVQNESKFDDVESHVESSEGKSVGTCTLFIDLLGPKTSETTLKALFSQYGRTTRVHRPRHEHGMYKGFAFVAMSTAEEAQSAVEHTNGLLLDGSSIRVALDAGKGSKAQPIPAVERVVQFVPPPIVQREVVVSIPAPLISAKKGEKICFAWRDRHNCKKGKQCPYPHMTVDEDGVSWDSRFGRKEQDNSSSGVRMEISTGSYDREVTMRLPDGETESSPASKARDNLTRGLTASRGGPVVSSSVVTTTASTAPTLSFQQMLTAQYSRQ